MATSRRMERTKSRGGGGGFLVFLILVLLAGGGAGYYYRRDIKRIVGELMAPADTGPLPDAGAGRNKPPGDVPAPPPDAGSTPVVAHAPPDVPVSVPASAASGRVLTWINDSEKALASLQFDKSRNFAQKALAANPPTAERLRAQNLYDRSSLYGDLLTGLTINPEASGELYHFYGESIDLEGVLEREDYQNYYVVINGGITAPISKEDVLEVRKIDESDKRSALIKELKDVRSANSDRGAVGLYLSAVFAYRNLLKDEVVPLLDEAFRLDPDLKQHVADHYAGKLLYKALWHDSIGLSYHAKLFLKELLADYPGSIHADSARKTLADIENRKKEILVTMKVEAPPAPAKTTIRNTPVSPAVTRPDNTSSSPAPSAPQEPPVKIQAQKVASSDPRVKAKVNEANKFFEEALVHYDAGRPGSPNSNRELRSAAALFEKAELLYNEAVDIDPANDQLSNRASDAARLRYNCMKMLTLSDS
ncbi:MAG: hypothetical protein JW909_11905 [Planctomycetes bacterium]|nr:hypothetical protein [Planctomycetota bacterium]